jgi:hypothetical protein
LPLAGEDRQNDVAIGDSGLQGFSAGLRTAATPSSGTRSRNLHELPIAVRVVLEAC